MTNDAIIRAWKDNVYRDSLSDAEKAMLPANPAGMVEIADHHLDKVDGATAGPCTFSVIVTITLWTVVASCYPGCCHCHPV